MLNVYSKFESIGAGEDSASLPGVDKLLVDKFIETLIDNVTDARLKSSSHG
jgi:hypothetical protein